MQNVTPGVAKHTRSRAHFRLALALLPAAATLTSCATTTNPLGPPEPPISAETVLNQLQQDLAAYFAYETQAAREDRVTHCGDRINFHVESVTISLTTLTGINRSGEAEAEVPVGGVTLGPSGAWSRDNRSSQTLTFTVVPHGDGGEAVRPPRPNTLDAVLRSLRESLLAVNATPPCLLLRPVEGRENTIAFGFTISRARTTGGEVDFLIFSLGAENTRRSEAAHTVTVRFVAQPHAPTATPAAR